MNLDLRRTALVVLDLQKGLLGGEFSPHSATDLVSRTSALADAVRKAGGTVVLVHVGFAPDFADAWGRLAFFRAHLRAMLPYGERIGITAAANADIAHALALDPNQSDAKFAVAAMVDPFPQVAGRGIGRLRTAGVRVDVGLLEPDAREMLRAWLRFI